MVLQRTDTTVTESKVVQAEYDDIIAFSVDLVNKSVSVTIGSGSMVEGKLNALVRKNFIIQDKPETNTYKEETLSIVDNKITTSEVSMDERVVFFVQTPIEDYTVNEKEVTFNNPDEISELTEIKVGYGYAMVADPVFSLMAASMADGDKSIYLNLKDLLWNKLIELGHVSGTII